MSATRTARELPAELVRLRRRFERLREERNARSRIPETLWASAAKMAVRHGVNRTAKALRLDYYSLKKRTEQKGGSAVRPQAKVAIPFIELAPAVDHGFAAVPVNRCECFLELESAGGAKMRVCLTSSDTPDLAALSRSFWNPEP